MPPKGKRSAKKKEEHTGIGAFTDDGLFVTTGWMGYEKSDKYEPDTDFEPYLNYPKEYYEEQAELVQEEWKQIEAEKKVMVKRFVLLKKPQVEALQERQSAGAVDFSVYCRQLSDWSKFSGKGKERGYMVTVYYVPAEEKKMLRVAKSVGVDLTKMFDGEDIEAEPVDPESFYDEEQNIMYADCPLWIMDPYEGELIEEGKEHEFWPKCAE